jgi:hypothetical protein
LHHSGGAPEGCPSIVKKRAVIKERANKLIIVEQIKKKVKQK